MSDMKEAVAEKRKRLEQLKVKREERKKVKEQQEKEKADKETILSAVPPSHLDQSVFSRVDSLLTGTSDQPLIDPSISNGLSETLEANNVKSSTVTTERKTISLVTMTPVITDIMPEEIVRYDKEVQAGDSGPNMEQLAAEEEEKARTEAEIQARKKREQEALDQQDKLRREQEVEERKARELTKQQKSAILHSKEFSDFFKRSSLLVERALNQNEQYDLTVDYSAASQSGVSEEKKLILSRTKFVDKTTEDRPVTSIDWSPQYKELLLASYAPKEDSLSANPDGLVLVWSLHMPKRPEYYFYCQSAVLVAQFHPSDPKLILGATHSGQVVIWDTREKSTPVSRTSLSNGHTHPIFAMSAMPNNTLHQIVSVSSDGKLCVWNDNDLVEPQAQSELKWDKKEVTVSSLSFSRRDATRIVLGSDEGKLYSTKIYEDPIAINEVINAHDAPITQVQFHPVQKNDSSDFSDLFLTCSYDWTVKLWTSKTSWTTNNEVKSKPLYTMESARDYVYDVQWSPTHPSLFVAGDGTGGLDFWDLSRDTEVPVHRAQLYDNKSDEKSVADRAVSRLKWNDEGKKLAVGMSDGSLHIADVADEIARADDLTTKDKFYANLQKAQNF